MSSAYGAISRPGLDGKLHRLPIHTKFASGIEAVVEEIKDSKEFDDDLKHLQ